MIDGSQESHHGFGRAGGPDNLFTLIIGLVNHVAAAASHKRNTHESLKWAVQVSSPRFNWIGHDDLLARFKQASERGLRAVYTVWGDEPLLAQEACDAIRQAARAASGSAQ